MAISVTSRSLDLEFTFTDNVYVRFLFVIELIFTQVRPYVSLDFDGYVLHSILHTLHVPHSPVQPPPVYPGD